MDASLRLGMFVFEGLLGFFFLAGAILNFSEAALCLRLWERLHLPRWYTRLAGTLLSVGATGLLVGLFVPVVGEAAALWMVAYFTVATVTQVARKDDLARLLAPLIFLVPSNVLAVMRWPEMAPVAASVGSLILGDSGQVNSVLRFVDFNSAGHIVVLVTEWLLGLFFLLSAVLHFSKAPSNTQSWRRLRLPRGYTALAGVVLSIGAVGLLAGVLIPVVGEAAALWMVAYFMVATVTQVARKDDLALLAAPLICMVPCVDLAIMRWTEVAALIASQH